MRSNFYTAVLVVLAALYGACGSRPLPNNAAGSMAGSTGDGGQGHPGGGTGGAAAGGAGPGGAGPIGGAAGGAGLTGAGGIAGGAGAGGAAGAPVDMPDCSPATVTGGPCAAAGSVCRPVVCTACSDQLWSLA